MKAIIIPRLALRSLLTLRLAVGRAVAHSIFNQDAEGVRRELLLS